MKKMLLLGTLWFFSTQIFAEISLSEKEIKEEALARGNVKNVVQNIISNFEKKHPPERINSLPENISIGSNIMDLDRESRLSDPDFIKLLREELKHDFPSWFRNWKGCMLLNGAIWFDWEGKKIIALNFSSMREKELHKLVEPKLKEMLVLAAFPLGDNVISCRAERHYIRVDRIGDEIRYLSWDIKKDDVSLLHKNPALHLTKGTSVYQGTSGDVTVTFKRGDYTYSLETDSMVTGVTSLRVKNREKILLQEPCKPISLILSSKDIRLRA